MSEGRRPAPGAAMRRWWASARPTDRAELQTDVVAGLPVAIGGVPDGMAASVLAGVNPVHGLYASLVAPIAGGLTSSTRLMVVTTTSAAALAAGSALAPVDPAERTEALFLLTALAGGIMVAAGLLKLGRYTRFVSHSVMTGFLTGVAVNILLSQLNYFTGVPSQGGPAIRRALHVITHPGLFDWPTLITGLCAIAILLALRRGPVASYASMVALAVPTIALQLLGTAGVVRVGDVGEIPAGLPLPHIPPLSAFSLNVVAGAFAVAAIVLVQGAGVSESAPNPDGTPADPNRDFIAQGAGNLAAGFYRGQPTGGSVGQTALNRSAGAVGRWAAVAAGVWMLVILALFSSLVKIVPMTTLAAVLIVASYGALRWGRVVTVWQAGPSSQIALVATFVATLLLPIAAAVGIGVVLSLLLQLNTELMDLKVVRLVPLEDGHFEEVKVPQRLEGRRVVLLDVYGSLLYAGSRTIEQHLPDPTGVDSPAVVLRLRGRSTAGSTAMVVIAGYADRVAAAGGHLFLSGVSGPVLETLERSGRIDLKEKVTVFEADAIVGHSSEVAYRAAETWLEDHPTGGRT